MIGSYIFGSLSLIFCIIFCIFRVKNANILSLILKTASSVCFLLCGIFALTTTSALNFGLMIVAGGIFGLIGDILLDLKVMHPQENDKYFVAGTCSFAIGHMFYFVAIYLCNYAVLPNNILWNILASFGAAILLTLAIMLPSKKLGLNFGKMLYISIAYCFILTFMMSFAISIAIFMPIFWIFAAGMIAFFLSDLVLSMQYFGGRDQKSLVFVNHIFYYIAQIMLAISIMFIMF